MAVRVGDSVSNGITKIFEFLPHLLGAVVLLVIGYFIAKIIGGVIKKALQKARFDRAMHNSAAGNYIARLVESPAAFLGKVAYWLIFLFFVSMAASALQLPLLDRIVNGIFSFIPRVISALIIFLVASAISGGAAAFVQRFMGRTPTAKMIATVIPVVTLSIASFMILNQLNIAKDIVNILFTAMVGSIALGMALAFGLGGRDVARDLLQKAYESGQQNAGAAQADMRRAKANAKQAASRVQDNL